MTMAGRRRDDHEWHLWLAGDYGHDANGQWIGITPTGHPANLSKHHVVEHDDHTITVSPSILVRGGPTMAMELWHGYLEHGAWRSC